MERLPETHFDGPDYQPELDFTRLTGQIKRIFILMADSKWRTLAEIASATHAPSPSVSAQLRHLRKPRFGAHTVERRRRGNAGRGLYEYRLLPKKRSLSSSDKILMAMHKEVIEDKREKRTAQEIAQELIEREQSLSQEEAEHMREEAIDKILMAMRRPDER